MCATPNETSRMRFIDWLQEPIHWQGGTVLPRWKVVRWFGLECLAPFLHEHGYRLGCSDQDFLDRLASGLYDNRSKCHMESEWRYPWTHSDAIAEEEDHFYHVVSRDKWETFWAAYGSWTDVSLDSFRGPDRRLDIEAFVWRQIDLETSPQTRVIAEVLLGGDDDEVAAPVVRKSTQDVYLQETVEYNGWGGYRRTT